MINKNIYDFICTYLYNTYMYSSNLKKKFLNDGTKEFTLNNHTF